MSEERQLPPHLYRACEAVGQVMELWGFKRIHGMIWMYIFLQPGPVSAKDIRDGLGISAGLVSMTIAELQHWDVVHRHSAPGERKDYYTAEANIGRPILKVLREREYYQIGAFLEVLREIRAELRPSEVPGDVFPDRQLTILIHLGEMALSLFNQFLDLGSLVMRGLPQMPVSMDTGQVLKALKRFLGKDAPAVPYDLSEPRP